MSDEPDIAERKPKAHFIDTFSKIVIIVAPVLIFKSEIHDAVLVIIKSMLQF